MSDIQAEDKDCADAHAGDREDGGLADQVRSLIALLKRHQAHLDALQADIESGDVGKPSAAGKLVTTRAERATAPRVDRGDERTLPVLVEQWRGHRFPA